MIKPPIVISGSIAIDRIMRFTGSYKEHIRPENIESLSISMLLDDMQDARGGVGANIAYSLAMLGDEPILLGAVGKDGAAYVQDLTRLGVNTKYVVQSPLGTASFNVITDADQNQVGGFYPGAMFDSEKLTLEPWKDKNPIVMVSPHDPKGMKRQVEECKKWDLRLCYDIGQQVHNLPGNEIAEGVMAAELLILNEYEMAVLSEKTGIKPADIKKAVPIVITTLGEKGSVIEGKKVGKPIQVGIVAPKKVVDPTGAGDAYRSGFLYGYARDWPLKTCAQLGAVCGAYAVETAGTQVHTFTFADVAKRYKKAFKEELPTN